MESGSNHKLLSLNAGISHYKKEMHIVGKHRSCRAKRQKLYVCMYHNHKRKHKWTHGSIYSTCANY